MSTEGKSGKNEREVPRFLVKMSAEAHLFKTYAFWGAVITPLAVAIALILLAVYKTPLYFDPSAEGFKFFYEHFKLQIALGSLSIPLGALVATQHRSMQTAQQIRTQTEEIEKQKHKDGVALHADHKKQFVSFITEAKPFNGHYTKNAWELYEQLYPLSSSSDLVAAKTAIDLVKSAQHELARELAKLQDESNGEIAPRSEVERVFGALKISADIEDFLEADYEVDVDSLVPPLSEKAKWISDLMVGLIQCCNFQHQSIEASRAKYIRKLAQHVSTYEYMLDQRRKTAQLISATILENNDMDYQTLHEHTKSRLKAVISKELNQLQNDSDIRELEIIIEHHLRNHNDKELMHSFFQELVDYFAELY